MSHHRPPPYEGKEAFFFISYAHRNAARVLDILAALYTQQRLRFWYDGRIQPGREWNEVISDHLTASSGVLCFVSAAFQRSANCQQELARARELHRPIVFVRLDNCRLNPWMQAQTSCVQWVTISRDYTPEQAAALIRENHLLEPSALFYPQWEALRPLTPRRRLRAGLAAASAAGLLAVGGLVLWQQEPPAPIPASIVLADACRQGDYTALWDALKDDNRPEALTAKGWLTAMGLGVQPDEKEAARLYRDAMEAGGEAADDAGRLLVALKLRTEAPDLAAVIAEQADNPAVAEAFESLSEEGLCSLKEFAALSQEERMAALRHFYIWIYRGEEQHPRQPENTENRRYLPAEQTGQYLVYDRVCRTLPALEAPPTLLAP